MNKIFIPPSVRNAKGVSIILKWPSSYVLNFGSSTDCRQGSFVKFLIKMATPCNESK